MRDRLRGLMRRDRRRAFSAGECLSSEAGSARRGFGLRSKALSGGSAAWSRQRKRGNKRLLLDDGGEEEREAGVAFGYGGISAEGKIKPAQQKRLASEHERENLGAAALKGSGQGVLVVEKGAGQRNEQLGALDVAVGGSQAESGRLLRAGIGKRDEEADAFRLARRAASARASESWLLGSESGMSSLTQSACPPQAALQIGNESLWRGLAPKARRVAFGEEGSAGFNKMLSKRRRGLLGGFGNKVHAYRALSIVGKSVISRLKWDMKH